MEHAIYPADKKLSELIERASLEGPQTLERQGKPVAVLLSFEEFQLLSDREPTLKELLMGMDLEGVDLSRNDGSEPDLPTT